MLFSYEADVSISEKVVSSNIEDPPQGGPVGDTDTMMLFALASRFWKQAKQSN